MAPVLGLEFGEKVIFMKATKENMMAKLRSKWGVRPRSNEIWVATAGRYGRCDDCQRMSDGRRTL